MKIFSGKKHKKGFTVMEVMLVVAILTAAMGIAVPGIVKLSDELKITKLDDIAREIYTSAQSQAISLSVGGQLSQVGGMVVEPAEGSGAPGETTVKYNYVYKSGTATMGEIDMLLPWGSIEEVVRQNSYIIEYNPVTAMILGVYYWEDEGNDFVTAGYPNADLTAKEARMTYGVGYYSGADVKPRLSAGDSNVKAGLVNDEELYLTILQGVGGSGAIAGTITVTLTDLDMGVSREIASFKNETIREDGSLVEKGASSDYSNIHYYTSKTDAEGNSIPAHFKLILDSLKPELRFSKLFSEGEDGSFHPGCNLKVTVSFQEEGKQVEEESFLTNSLFASVEERELADGTFDRTAYISCGRHLKNLGLFGVYPDGPTNMSDKLNGVTKAVQTADIDWGQSLEKVYVADPDDPSASPVSRSFKPIVNEALKEFDGGDNTISVNINGAVETGSPGIGLFSEFKGNSLKNINLVNCTVEDLTVGGSDPLYVGLLAGRIANTSGECKITGCHAYATKDERGILSDCSIKTPGNTNSAGGLFGSVQSTGGNVTIERCSASLMEIAGNAKYVGGLAGSIDSNNSTLVTISQCYANTGVRSSIENKWEKGMSGTNVGGLLGSITGSGSFALENSYAVGGILTATNAYGLVGAADSVTPTIQTCYAALLKGNDIVDKLVPTGITLNNCINYCGSYSGFDSLLDISLPGNSEKLFVKGDEAEQVATSPYGKSGSYPFPRLKDMIHYGDWPEKMEAVQMAYFEVYRGDAGNYSIGFYSKESNKEIFNTLRDDGIVVMDGYAVMFPVKDMPELTVQYNGGEVATYPSNLSNSLKLMNAKEKFLGLSFGDIGIDSDMGIGIPITEDKTKAYYPLFLSSAMMVEKENGLANKDLYYQKLEVGRIKREGETELTEPFVSVYFNPYVAKSDFVEVTPGAAFTPPAVPAVSILRTSRQITAYTTFEAMQKTAIGDSTVTDSATGTFQTHRLRLERNIALTEDITTDSTITDVSIKKCKDLSIPAGIKLEGGSATANVILELNGKTLLGTGEGSVVSSLGGRLTVYGYTAENLDGTGSTTTEGKITGGDKTPHGGGIYVKGGTFNMTGGIISGNKADAGSGIYMENGTTGKLTSVRIEDNTVMGDAEDKNSIYMTGDITLDGCKIINNK